jgi:RsiW-degrading membrane proteinase PrsW (M82 family)
MALLRLFSVVAAALPTALYVLLFWWVDRHEKEPRALLLGAFVWGAVPSVMLSLIIESWLARPLSVFGQGYASVVGSTLIAPPIEEVAKGLALWGLYRWARAEMDGDLDGIVYGAVVGLGFAMVENIFYFWTALEESGLSAWATIIPVRALAFGLNHAVFTAFTGVGFARARYTKGAGSRRGVVLRWLLLAIAVHMAHNALANAGLCILSLLLNWAGALLVLVMVVLSWRREVAWMREHLAEEVSLGILTEPLYQVLSSRERYSAVLRRLRRSGLRRARILIKLLRSAAELAQKKHQLAHLGEESGNSATIDALRQQIIHLRLKLYE